MSYLIICGTAFLSAGLTLLSGFGLGTLLLPAFMLFFPPALAVAATAVVHLLNNIFKLFLVGKHADRGVALRFAVPAAFASLLGALLLTTISRSSFHFRYVLSGNDLDITPVKAVIAFLMLVFGLFEMVPRFQKLSFHRRFVPLGGALSGFVGGISGHQGALRAAFLIKAGLSKESFIGTSVVSAIVVDVVRITVYGITIYAQMLSALYEGNGVNLLAAATVAAFVGSLGGARLMNKVTYRSVRHIVGTLLLALAFLFGFGVI